MIVILAHITAEDEDGGKEAVVKATKGIEEDIEGLLRCAPCDESSCENVVDDITALSRRSTRIWRRSASRTDG